MSVKNGRLYQYLLSKTHVGALALIATLLIRTIVRAMLWCAAALRSGKKTSVDARRIAEARARLSQAFPKPVCTQGVATPVPADATIDLSVIVPVYNPGAFFAPCIASVLGQETRFRFELILIDDGSDDATQAALSNYASDARVIVLRQSNAGAAAARNRGLDRARGQYIMFVDADDMLLPGAIEALMRAAQTHDADWVQGGWAYTDGPTQIFPDAVCAGAERMRLIELPGMPWGKVLRRTLFDKLRFPAGYTSYVDTPIKCLTLRMAARAATVSEVVYAWRRNPGGITFTSKNTPRALQTYWIMEQMQEDSRSLALPEDDLYQAIWVRQMLSVNYDRLKGLDEPMRRDAFVLSCDFLSGVFARTPNARLPFTLRLARRAFERNDFELWQLLARFYALSL